jgi:hypothetical protein
MTEPVPRWRPIADARHDGTLYVVRTLDPVAQRYDGGKPYIAWWWGAPPAAISSVSGWVRENYEAMKRPAGRYGCAPAEFLCEVPA